MRQAQRPLQECRCALDALREYSICEAPSSSSRHMASQRYSAAYYGTVLYREIVRASHLGVSLPATRHFPGALLPRTVQRERRGRRQGMGCSATPSLRETPTSSLRWATRATGARHGRPALLVPARLLERRWAALTAYWHWSSAQHKRRETGYMSSPTYSSLCPARPGQLVPLCSVPRPLASGGATGSCRRLAAQHDASPSKAQRTV